MNGYTKPKTICWDCANACGGCSWSDHWKHKPVEGWNAVRNDLHNKDGAVIESYIVYECPEFVRDSVGYGQHRVRRNQDEGCMQDLQAREKEVG